MSGSIIARRIERAAGSSWSEADGTPRRRGTYQNGKYRYPCCVNLRFGPDQLAELDALCNTLRVARGIIVRDAVMFYLGMAKQEGLY